MKKYIFLVVLAIGGLFSLCYAQQGSRGRWGNEPEEILDNVAGATNQHEQILENEMNDVSRTDGSYGFKNRITNTLVSVTENIVPYLDWIVYGGLILAIVLVIYNGFRLMTGALLPVEHSTTIKNMKNIGIGSAILFGFRFIVKVAMIVFNSVLGQ